MERYLPYLQELSKISDETLEIIPSDLKDTNLLVTLLLERLSFTANSCHVLLPAYFKDPRHEFSLGLILRTALLDALITGNLDQMFQTEPLDMDILDEFSFDILTDGTKYVLRAMAEEEDPRLAEAYASLVRLQPGMFEPYKFDGSQPIPSRPHVKERAKTANLFGVLKGKGPVGVAKFYSLIYSKYSIYSKYEHLSVFYHMVNRSTKGEVELRLSFCFDLLGIEALTHHAILKYQFPEHPEFEKQYAKVDHLVMSMGYPSSNASLQPDVV